MREWSAKVQALADRQAGRVAWWQLNALGADDKTSVEQAVLDFAAVAPLERVRHVLANADYHNVLDIAGLRGDRR